MVLDRGSCYTQYILQGVCSDTTMCTHSCNVFDYCVLFQKEKCVAGSKPCLIFTGDLFETDENYRRLKNFLIGTPPLVLKCDLLVRVVRFVSWRSGN